VQSPGALGNSAGPTIVDTYPIEPVSEGKVRGSAIGSEQATGPQAPNWGWLSVRQSDHGATRG
jgi:hypothetical protein